MVNVNYSLTKLNRNMSFKPEAALIYHTAILLLLVSLHGEINVESLSCSVDRETNTIIDIKMSRQSSKMTRAINGSKVTDELTCSQRCCNEAECTEYVYYNSLERKFNCFLIRCLPLSSCIRKNLSESVVGVMDRNSLKNVDAKSHTVTSVKSNQGMTLETSITQTPIDSESSAFEQPANRAVSNPSNGRNVSTMEIPTSTPPSTPVSTPSGTPSSTAQISTAPSHAPSTSNSVIPQNSSSPSTHPTTKIQKQISITPTTMVKSHTNTTSLVIALFFGILFLLAVILIVGRPWWEFIQRPRYSKVDYLMNGL